MFYDTPETVIGGRVFKLPFVQKVQKISLNTMTINIVSPNVLTEQGVAVTVEGVAQVKVSSTNQDMLNTATTIFMGKSEREISSICQETLEGHQRAIMGNMTVEEIYQDRQKFSTAVFEEASSNLVRMGIQVISYTIKSLTDDQGYLEALGATRTAQVKRDARIGEAEAQRDSGIKEAMALEKQQESKFYNDTQIALAKRDFELKKAEFDKEVETKKASSALAYDLQKAKTQQLIKEENMQVKVVERMQEIKIQEEEMNRKEKELQATVRRPAEAEKYRLERLAEANKNRVVLEGEAEAETLRLKGEAEAFAIQAKAAAEAEQMAKKAAAFAEYDEAAKVAMVLDMLPKLAAECAAPLNGVSKIRVVAGGNGDIGAAKLTSEVVDIMGKLPALIEANTGVNIINRLKSSG